MPIEYRVDQAKGILYSTASGRLTSQEVMEIDRQVRSDPDVLPEYHQISDFRGVTDLDVETRYVSSVARTQPYFLPTARSAVVAKGPLAVGMTRMFELSRGEDAGEIQIFPTIEAAEAWVLAGFQGGSPGSQHPDLYP